MSRAVPDYGPYTAPLLVIGEAGGKEEGTKGRPFVGATGRKVREMIAAAGMDPERDVRYANVIPVEMHTLPKIPARLQAVVRAHWHAIEATLLRGSHEAVLAYGRAALWRLTGRTKITDEHGSVYDIEVGGRKVPLVVSIHPAAIMHTKIEAGWTLVRAATERACRYATGTVYDPFRQLPTFEYCYDDSRVQYIYARCTIAGLPLAIDTEFDRVTKRPFMIGLSCDGEHVHSFVPTDDSIKGIKYLLDSPNIVKIFHHAPADMQALATLGITVRPPVMDTLMLHATCYPDLPVGLERVALHLFDHWRSWKGMPHDDPLYNAIDVVATWRAYVQLHQQATDMNLWPMIAREVQHMSVLCMAMEARGLQVDPTAQRAAVDANAIERAALRDEIQGHVAAVFAKRRVPYERELVEISAVLDGIKQPRLKKDRDPEVATVVANLRKRRDRCRTVIARWTQGFDLGNNDHLRWLLYDADGFKLPVQKVDGQPTANADAVARLLALKRVQENDVIKLVLGGVKQYQHARKMTNTFLLWNERAGVPSPAIDTQGCAHPEYRPFGTGTGRLAGGPDSDLGDRTTNPYAYNALNIPEETRSIYTPHPAAFVVDTTTIATEVSIDDDDELAAGDLS